MNLFPARQLVFVRADGPVHSDRGQVGGRSGWPELIGEHGGAALIAHARHR